MAPDTSPIMTLIAIQSPCIKVCAIDGETQYCLGCGRTLPEIGRWSRIDPDERREITSKLPARLDKLRALGKLGPKT